MTCSICKLAGHNKRTCKKQLIVLPIKKIDEINTKKLDPILQKDPILQIDPMILKIHEFIITKSNNKIILLQILK